KAYETRAQQYAAADKWQRVRDTYTEIRRLDPTAAGPSYERGKASGAMGAYPQALADFTRAIGPGAAPPEDYEARGDLHIPWAGRAGRAAEEKVGAAVKDYVAALQRLDGKAQLATQRRAELHRKLGLAHILLNNRPEAEKESQRAAEQFRSRLDK